MTGDEIRNLRTALGLTQARFAEVLGVHVLTLSRWECSRVTPDGATAQLLRVLSERVRQQQPNRDVAKVVLTALAGGAVVVGLAALLDALFGEDK